LPANSFGLFYQLSNRHAFTMGILGLLAALQSANLCSPTSVRKVAKDSGDTQLTVVI
jgi:hypothetical protein